jgi:membrane protease subunit HflK
MVGSALALLALIWAGSGLYTLDAGERGIVLRFGEYRAVIAPGLHWRAPWPIETVSVVDTGHVETFEYTDRMLTADENIVAVNLMVQYTRADPIAFAFNMRDPEALLRAASRSAIREVVGTSDISYILTEGRAGVAQSARAIIQATLDAHSAGISVQEANLRDANLPSDIDAAVQDVVMAREDRQRIRLEAETYANSIVPVARGDAARLRAEAEAYRARVIAEAGGDSERFALILEEYRASPLVTRERLYLEAIEDVMGTSAKTLLSTNGTGHVLRLPLNIDDSAPADNSGELAH